MILPDVVAESSFVNLHLYQIAGMLLVISLISIAIGFCICVRDEIDRILRLSH